MLTTRMIDPSASMIRALLFAALSCAGAACSLEEVGRSITRANVGTVRETLCDAWMASMAEPPKRLPLSEENSRRWTWTEAWAAARYDLKLSDDEWLDMTPRQVAALENARIEQMQREELLIGVLAATFENFSFYAPKKSVSPETFMLHKLPPEPELPIGDQIMKQMAKLKQ
jgi:hypothetical protein